MDSMDTPQNGHHTMAGMSKGSPTRQNINLVVSMSRCLLLVFVKTTQPQRLGDTNHGHGLSQPLTCSGSPFREAGKKTGAFQKSMKGEGCMSPDINCDEHGSIPCIPRGCLSSITPSSNLSLPLAIGVSPTISRHVDYCVLFFPSPLWPRPINEEGLRPWS